METNDVIRYRQYVQCEKYILDIYEKHRINYIGVLEEYPDVFIDIFVKGKLNVDLSTCTCTNMCSEMNICTSSHVFTGTNICTSTYVCTNKSICTSTHVCTVPNVCTKNNICTGIKYDVLGIYYYWILRDNTLAIDAWFKAVEIGNVHAMNHLGVYYSCEYRKYKNHISKIIESKVKQLKQRVCKIFGYQYNYDTVNDLFNKCVYYYQMAIENGNVYALCNVGWFYYREKNYDLAIDFFNQAVEKSVVDGLRGLGCCSYSSKKDYEQAINYFITGYEHGDSYCFRDMLTLVKNHAFDNNTLYLIYKTVYLGRNDMHMDEIISNCTVLKISDFDKWKILNRLCEEMVSCKIEEFMRELEKNHDVLELKRKILRAKTNGDYDTCLLCLDENVLNVNIGCGHKVCVECYKPSMKCVYSWCKTICTE